MIRACGSRSRPEAAKPGERWPVPLAPPSLKVLWGGGGVVAERAILGLERSMDLRIWSLWKEDRWSPRTVRNPASEPCIKQLAELQYNKSKIRSCTV